MGNDYFEYDVLKKRFDRTLNDYSKFEDIAMIQKTNKVVFKRQKQGGVVCDFAFLPNRENNKKKRMYRKVSPLAVHSDKGYSVSCFTTPQSTALFSVNSAPSKALIK